MKIGIATNITWFGAPVVDVAKAAEALGFESLWMGEHIVIPVDIKNPVRHGVPLPPSYRHMPDPFIWLTAGIRRVVSALQRCTPAASSPSLPVT